MKNYFLIVTMLLVCIAYNANAEENSRYLNFEVGKATITSDLGDELETGLDFGGSFTFMKANNWGWDFAVNYTTFDVIENPYLKGSIGSLSFLAGIRYNFISKPNSFSPYFRLGAGIVYEFEDLDLTVQGEKKNIKADETMLGIRPALGILVPFNEKFRMNIECSYLGNIELDDHSTNDDFLSLYSFLKLDLGVSIKID